MTVSRFLRYILLILVVVGLHGCASRKKNSATTRAYHSFTARYNTYYNGSVAFRQGNVSQVNGHKDNYLEQLPLLIVSDKQTQKNGASNYDKAIEKAQKAIKNHSIKRKPKRPAGKKLSKKQRSFYAQKEFNPFLWRAWFLMAESQFQKGEFTEAASTYIYIARLYENDPEIVAQANIGLALCYTELGWLYETEELLQRTARDTVPGHLREEFARAKGNLLMKQERFKEAIPQIALGIKRDDISSLEKAREYYLLGQLYAKTGDLKSAYRSFGKTISKSPPYELEFNARIRQTETATEENHKKILRKLKRMSRSPKNKEYLSQIYYAIGNIHLSHKDTTEAIVAYETGVAEGATGGYGTAMLHLSLAKIYWKQDKFSKAHENYGKALPLITEETPGHEEAKFRSEVLGDIVQYTDIVEKESELLYWATLSPEQLYPILDKRIKEEKIKEELRKKEEKKLERNERGNTLDNAGNMANMTIEDPEQKQQWYFYNRQSVAQGIRTFRQNWGERELKDYWRFSHEIPSLTANDTIPTDSTEYNDSIDSAENHGDIMAAGMDSTYTQDAEVEELNTDPTTREYYIQQIPVTDEQKEKSHIALSNALFESGIRFKEKINDKRLSLLHLEQVAGNYPEYERIAETYYHLFMACSRWNETEKAEAYKRMLIERFPDSSMTKRIQEPDFLESTAVRRHKEDSIYVKAYEHYRAEEYEDVERESSYAATKYPKGNHRSRFMFIDAMSKLYNGRQEEGLNVLNELTKSFPNDSISRIANEISTGINEGRLLKSDVSASIWERKADGTIKGGTDSIPQFSTERNGPYYFVLAFPNGSVNENRLLFEIARHNFSRYMVRNFEMTFEKLAEVTLFEVKEFLNFDEAFVYSKRLYGQGETAKLLEGINAMIISKTNLDLLLQYYSFEDYRKFYEKEFLAIPEIEIDGYTLDEPDYDNARKEENSNK